MRSSSPNQAGITWVGVLPAQNQEVIILGLVTNVREDTTHPLRLIYGEWIEVEDDPRAIQEKSLYLLMRAENRRRREQGKRQTLLTFDFTCMNLGYGGFRQMKLENGKIKLELNTHLIEENPGDGYMSEETHAFHIFIPLQIVKR